MVNCWYGFLGSPIKGSLLLKGTLRIPNHRGPNIHQKAENIQLWTGEISKKKHLLNTMSLQKLVGGFNSTQWKKYARSSKVGSWNPKYIGMNIKRIFELPPTRKNGDETTEAASSTKGLSGGKPEPEMAIRIRCCSGAPSSWRVHETTVVVVFFGWHLPVV